MTTTKACRKCEKVLPLDQFYKNKGNKDGRQSYCKACKSGIQRDWRQRNPSATLESNAKWKRRNRTAVNSINQRRRARLAKAGGFHTPQQWQARLDYHGNRCYYCTSEHNLTIDHRIPLSRGGTNWPSNLVPACQSCNSSKGTRTETEYVQM